jgi:hypothetical protein
MKPRKTKTMKTLKTIWRVIKAMFGYASSEEDKKNIEGPQNPAGNPHGSGNR